MVRMESRIFSRRTEGAFMETRNELIREIESAFADVILESGIGIFEAETIDNYTTKTQISHVASGLGKVVSRDSFPGVNPRD